MLMKFSTQKFVKKAAVVMPIGILLAASIIIAPAAQADDVSSNNTQTGPNSTNTTTVKDSQNNTLTDNQSSTNNNTFSINATTGNILATNNTTVGNVNSGNIAVGLQSNTTANTDPIPSLGLNSPLTINSSNILTGPNSNNALTANFFRNNSTIINRSSNITNDVRLALATGNLQVNGNTKVGNVSTGNISVGIGINNQANSSTSSTPGQPGTNPAEGSGAGLLSLPNLFSAASTTNNQPRFFAAGLDWGLPALVLLFFLALGFYLEGLVNDPKKYRSLLNNLQFVGRPANWVEALVRRSNDIASSFHQAIHATN